MACQTRERTGSCNHSQCLFSNETDHGYECVDIRSGFCEVGEGCLEKCSYSWKPTDKKASAAALEAFDAYCKRLESFHV